MQGIWLSIGLSVGALYYTFVYVHEFNNEKATVNLFGNVGFFLPSIQASALRILALFIWKQTILTIIRKDECINIRFAPYIEWID